MASHMTTDTEQARFNMIEQQIRPAEVLDTDLLAVISKTPRENFVVEQYRELAFSDINVPLNDEQIMMKPIMEGRLLQALNIQATDNILEIGTGSGYLTALLATLGQQVTSIEIDPELLANAQKNLDAQGVNNATLIQGDAAQGWDKNGSFDVIAVTGSFPLLPDSFQQQLNVGGRLIAIVGQTPVMQMTLITRISAEQWDSVSLYETDFPALNNAEQPPAFIF
jgi:protein-L-isoaspartate(D-aspartate) O-methyltransferase